MTIACFTRSPKLSALASIPVQISFPVRISHPRDSTINFPWAIRSLFISRSYGLQPSDCACETGELLDRKPPPEMPAVAITDHGNLFAAQTSS